MKRRTFLTGLSTTAAVGLAGCTSQNSILGTSVDCNTTPADAQYAGYATSESLFLSTSGDGPTFFDKATIDMAQRAAGLSRPAEKITLADNQYDRSNGFLIRDNVSSDTAINVFKKAGIGIGKSWWNYETPITGSWGDMNEPIATRHEAASEFTASKDDAVTLPAVTIAESNTYEPGKRALWAVTGADSKTHAKNAIRALNLPTGLAFAPGNPQFNGYHPVSADEAVTGVDVTADQTAATPAFTVHLELDPAVVADYQKELPADVSTVQVFTGGAALSLDLDEAQSDSPVATTTLGSWNWAYATATSFASTLRNPVFTSSLSSC